MYDPIKKAKYPRQGVTWVGLYEVSDKSDVLMDFLINKCARTTILKDATLWKAKRSLSKNNLLAQKKNQINISSFTNCEIGSFFVFQKKFCFLQSTKKVTRSGNGSFIDKNRANNERKIGPSRFLNSLPGASVSSIFSPSLLNRRWGIKAAKAYQILANIISDRVSMLFDMRG